MSETFRNELDKLIASAPAKVEGRPPTQEEIEALRAHQAKIKSYLSVLPPDQRRLYSTSSSGTVVGEMGEQNRTKANKHAARASNPRNNHQLVRPSARTGGSATTMEVDYLCVLDFEATCNNKRPAPRPQEIIEFPTLLLNVRTGMVEDELHYYIQPDEHPTLTEFCTELTGISQDQVNNGISLDRALTLHQNWLGQRGLMPVWLVPSRCSPAPEIERRPTFLYLTCGDWDLKTCLPSQLQYHGKQVPSGFKDWINIKHEFQHLYGKKAGGMVGMLRCLGMELEGRHHSGIDDCRNIARICLQMIKDGWVPGSAARNKRLPATSPTLSSDNTIQKPNAPSAKERVLVGVVGTSRGGLVDKTTAWEVVSSTLSQVVSMITETSDDKELWIVSGGGIVPTLAFRWASEQGYQAKQVVSAAVRSKPKNVESRMVFGKNHGDESKVFIKMIDVFVRIGGGPQSHEELRQFKRIHPEGLIVEMDLPLLTKG